MSSWGDGSSPAADRDLWHRPRRRLWIGLLLAGAIALGGCAGIGVSSYQDPLSAQEHLILGRASEVQGELAQARHHYERAADTASELAEAWRALGDLLLRMEEWAGSVAAYERAISIERSPPILNNLAWALAQEGRDLTRAEALARGALAEDPSDRYMYLDTLGVVLTIRGQGKEAATMLEEALGLTPTEAPKQRALIFLHLGKAQQAAGMHQRARQSFGNALSLDPYGSVGAEARQLLTTP